MPARQLELPKAAELTLTLLEGRCAARGGRLGVI
jgi:hypothetical protein